MALIAEISKKDQVVQIVTEKRVKNVFLLANII